MNVDLVLFKKDGSQKTFSLRSDISVIGRHDDCELRVPISAVSRKHCQLSKNNQTVKLRDLGSRNGTLLNGKRIKEEAPAKAGDYISIGPLTFLLQINGEPKKIIQPKPVQPKPVPKKPAEAKAPDKPVKEKTPQEPPKQQKPQEIPEAPAPENDLSGSFPDLDLDDSGSFEAELENL
jgi:pSer/pThr/pTyr-binding forkhead associated (FHA) protein